MDTIFSPVIKKSKMKLVIDAYFGVDCLTKTRKRPYITARQVYTHCLHKFTDMKLREIARAVGCTDHATVIHSIKLVKYLCLNNERFRNQVIEIESMIE